MSLRKTILDIIFNKGLNTKTDNKLTVGANLLGLENAVMRKAGKLEKRKGMDKLDSPFSAPKAIISSGEQLSVVDSQDKLYGFNESSNRWRDKGTLASSSVSTKTLLVSDDIEIYKDQAEINGLHCLVWRDSADNLRITLTDLTSGTVAVSKHIVATSIRGIVRVEVVRGQFIILWLEGANVKRLVLSPNTPQILTDIANIRADASTSYDNLGTFSDGNFVYLVYNNTTPVATVVKYNINGGVISFNNLSDYLTFNLDIVGTTVADVSKLVVVGFNNTARKLNYAVLENNLSIETDVTLALTSGVDILNQTLIVQNGTTTIYYTIRDSAASSEPDVHKASITFAGAFSDDGVWFNRAILTAAAYLRNETVHVPLQLFNTNRIKGTNEFNRTQDTHFVVTDAKDIIAFFASGEAEMTTALLQSGLQCLPHSLVVGDSTRLSLNERNGKINLKTLDFAVQDTYSFVSVNNQTLISGGILYNYDGLQVTENGFTLFPDFVNVSQKSDTGKLSAGSYQYTAVFRWLDARGNKHTSATAIPMTLTVTAGYRVEVDVMTLFLTNKSNVKVDIYRTEANGSLFYYVGTMDNDTSTNSSTYVDTTTDADLIAGELLLTSRDEIDSIVNQSLDKVVLHKDRVFVTGLQDKNLVRYSKQIRNEEGIAFNEALEFRVEQLGGGITALQSMDNNLIIFKNERIYVVGGDPLDDFLNGTGFGSPELLSSDVGCINSRSIVLGSEGIYFKSNKGIYLLNRGLTVSYVGDRVEDYNDHTITGAELVEDQNEVRFSTQEGVVLVYNTYFDIWSVFPNLPATDSGTWKSKYVLISSRGVLVEGTSYRDDGASYSMKIATGWIATSGIQGFQRIYRTFILGELETSHRLKVKIYNNYAPGSVQTTYINPNNSFGTSYGTDTVYGANNYGSTAAGIYQYGIHHQKQKCQSFRLEISDEILNEELENDGQGFSLNAISVQVGSKQGFNKTNNTQQY